MRADQYVSAQNGAVRLAERDLQRAWEAGRLRELWPLLIARYGEVTATLAADRFETLTGMGAVMVDPIPVGKLNARMEWGLTPAIHGDGDAALARLMLLTDELVKQPGRDTIAASARKRKIRVARVPTGDKTCAWCLMLASRGAVFGSEATALAASHGKCDCRLEPVVDDSDLRRLKAEGYDLDRYQRTYADNIVRSKGVVDPKATLAAIRESEGSH